VLACVANSRDSLQLQIEASRSRRSGQTAAAGRRTQESGAQVGAARPGRTTARKMAGRSRWWWARDNNDGGSRKISTEVANVREKP
jgi:hypothetical protein